MRVFCIGKLDIRDIWVAVVPKEKTGSFIGGDNKVSLLNDIKCDIICWLLLKTFRLLDRCRIQKRKYIS